MHEEGVVHGVVGRLELVLAAHLVEVFYVPAEGSQHRLDQGVLGVLFADRLAPELRDPFAHARERDIEIRHVQAHVPHRSLRLSGGPCVRRRDLEA